jgi:hypothetical protein
MELDIYIPCFQLAFEYQGGHHYNARVTANLSQQQRRDTEKKTACRNLGITLIEVPYWWTSSPHILSSTISKLRPDIPLNRVKPQRTEQTSFHPTPTANLNITLSHRKYFDWIAVQLKIETQEEWYNYSSLELRQKLGAHILHSCYSNSLFTALQRVYPEYTWYPWMFRKLPANFWTLKSNQIDYLSWVTSHIYLGNEEHQM